MKNGNRKIYRPIIAASILTSVVIIYLFASGLYTKVFTNHILVYLGTLSFLLGLICIIVPYLARYSRRQSPTSIKYLYFYGPAYFFILTGLWCFSTLIPNLPFLLDIIFYILLFVGFIFNYVLAKRIDQSRRAAGEID